MILWGNFQVFLRRLLPPKTKNVWIQRVVKAYKMLSKLLQWMRFDEDVLCETWREMDLKMFGIIHLSTEAAETSLLKFLSRYLMFWWSQKSRLRRKLKVVKSCKMKLTSCSMNKLETTGNSWKSRLDWRFMIMKMIALMDWCHK